MLGLFSVERVFANFFAQTGTVILLISASK
jgi:hypothetical protein